ncbi:hypothetical protein DV736_g5594, partial [Chaetothyriales sp. CBS 134916]
MPPPTPPPSPCDRSCVEECPVDQHTPDQEDEVLSDSDGSLIFSVTSSYDSESSIDLAVAEEEDSAWPRITFDVKFETNFLADSEAPSSDRRLWQTPPPVFQRFIEEIIYSMYILVQLSVIGGNVTPEPHVIVGSVQVPSIAQLNDGSWEILVQKAYLPTLRLQQPNLILSEYDPLEPLEEDVKYWGYDRAWVLNTTWSEERAPKGLTGLDFGMGGVHESKGNAGVLHLLPAGSQSCNAPWMPHCLLSSMALKIKADIHSTMRIRSLPLSPRPEIDPSHVSPPESFFSISPCSDILSDERAKPHLSPRLEILPLDVASPCSLTLSKKQDKPLPVEVRSLSATEGSRTSLTDLIDTLVSVLAAEFPPKLSTFDHEVSRLSRRSLTTKLDRNHYVALALYNTRQRDNDKLSHSVFSKLQDQIQRKVMEKFDPCELIVLFLIETIAIDLQVPSNTGIPSPRPPCWTYEPSQDIDANLRSTQLTKVLTFMDYFGLRQAQDMLPRLKYLEIRQTKDERTARATEQWRNMWTLVIRRNASV